MLFRVLLTGSATKSTSVGGIIASMGVHGTLAALAVAGGLEPPVGLTDESPWSEVIYLAPPPQSSSGAARVERVTFVGLDGGTGGTESLKDAAPDEDALAAERRAREARERAAVDELPGPSGLEGNREPGEIFLESQVENPAAYDASSAAPRYPEALRAENIEGSAIVQFVVDTTGLADTASFLVLQASHEEFVMSVRTALPGMRFTPARSSGQVVRQLVQIPFLFRIETASFAADTMAADTMADSASTH